MSQPIFVVGTMRSGSTLLRLILDSHENIAIGEETGFAGALAATKQIPNWRYGGEWYSRLGWSEEELDERLRDFYGPMFERHATSQGKARWGDKTPFHSWHMADLARVFPDAVFLAISRHPAAVVASLTKKFHYGVEEAADYWTSTNLEVLRHGKDLGGDRFALIRYEDIVGEPEPTLRDLMDWLGEPWSDDLLRHQAVQAAKGAPRLVDGSTSTRAPIDSARANAWRQILTTGDQETVRQRTGAVAAFLGYDAHDASRCADLTSVPPEPRRRLMTGDGLRTRHRSWSPPLALAPQDRGVVVADMSVQDMARRLAQAEASLARVRSRPVVRASDAVRRAQKRASLPNLAELRTAARRSLRARSQRRPPRQG
ncbi:MAG: sulfotransferase [Sporichthyaceae bacterium]|nr:sulfotransferase [Sporichthyaceae bacterium]